MRLFTDILRQMRGGRAADQMTRLLHEATEASLRTRKPGSVTLTIGIKPDANDPRGFTLTPSCAMKKPQPDMSGGQFWMDEKGEIVREDPTQSKMFEDADTEGRFADKEAATA